MASHMRGAFRHERSRLAQGLPKAEAKSCFQFFRTAGPVAKFFLTSNRMVPKKQDAPPGGVTTTTGRNLGPSFFLSGRSSSRLADLPFRENPPLVVTALASPSFLLTGRECRAFPEHPQPFRAPMSRLPAAPLALTPFTLPLEGTVSPSSPPLSAFWAFHGVWLHFPRCLPVCRGPLSAHPILLSGLSCPCLR